MTVADDREVVIVTGAATGFGNLTALALAETGRTVYAGMRDTRGRHRGTADELETAARDRGLALRALELDVRDDNSVAAAVDEVMTSAGRVDVVVNNAGVSAIGPLEAFDTKQLQDVFDTNVFGPFRLNQAVLPHMRQRERGLLVHVSSVVGRILPNLGGPYPASKWALEGLAEGLAHQVAPFGIDVVIVEPGAFPTDSLSRGMAARRADVLAEYAAKTSRIPPMGYGDPAPDPREVADAIVRVVETPRGARALRQVVGSVMTAGAADYNEAYVRARALLVADMTARAR